MSTAHHSPDIILSVLSIFILLSTYASAEPDHNCRLFAAFGNLNGSVLYDDLVTAPNSLKQLSASNRNGWGIITYENDRAEVFRGLPAAVDDPSFDEAVQNISNARIVLSHVRACSSGCCDVPDPHPFTRTYQGKTWSFIHNGNIPKALLYELMGEAYVRDNPPQTCPDNPVDSELYFMYIMQQYTNDKNMEQAIYHATSAITEKMQGEGEQINFIMSDGETVWAYRKGPTLQYQYTPETRTTLIASEPPHGEAWTALPQASLLVVKEQELPVVINFEEGVQVASTAALPSPTTPAPEHTVPYASFRIITGLLLIILLFWGSVIRIKENMS